MAVEGVIPVVVVDVLEPGKVGVCTWRVDYVDVKSSMGRFERSNLLYTVLVSCSPILCSNYSQHVGQ